MMMWGCGALFPALKKRRLKMIIETKFKIALAVIAVSIVANLINIGIILQSLNGHC